MAHFASNLIDSMRTMEPVSQKSSRKLAEMLTG
jgi:hypothetical protein